MAYVTPEEIGRAKEMDLLAYLQRYAPEELVHVAGNTYCTKEHDSLKISNGKWHWFSRGIGGRSALDYLIKVQEVPFTQAVEILAGRAAAMPPVSHAPPKVEAKRLLLPEPDENMDAVVRYLTGRGIHPTVIGYCVTHKLVYQSREYRNAVFVGYDLEGTPRYAALRSTTGPYKGDAGGSDKRYSFSIAENSAAREVHIFESAIDLLSYASLQVIAGQDWRQEALLSLAGVFLPKWPGVVPAALTRFLGDYPQVRTLHLHLDNDAVGRGAARGIIGGLGGKYQIHNAPPRWGKDVNDLLQMRLGLCKRREELSG
ncbi:MAG: DUF3991 domain-containing protein [Oscillospiraceae bacterium]|nr:DUF3991 domain-containing protein [Oscillospiraceae bacterium]